MTAEILSALLKANLALAAGAALVLLARKPVRTLFGARAAYTLWSLPVLAALASLLPQPERTTLLSPFVAEAAEAAAGVARPALAQPSADGVLTALWLAGALAAALLLLVRQARFMAEVRAGRAGPAVVGVFAPRIVTPADFPDRFDAAEREVILSHEAQHLASGDAAVNALAAALQCLCWFNPLVHLGARAMRIDQELACDAAVLARTPEKRRLYAEVLLKTQLAGQALPFGCHWPARAEHPLKERIAMLKSPLPRRARRIAGLAAVAALSAAGAAAAWAAQGPAPEKPLIAQPDWIQRPTAEDVVRFYPAAAAAQKLGGQALITCEVSADGRLTGCKLLKEDPAGAGFGEAALKMSAQFQMKPMSRNGQPVSGGVVRIPIRFSLPQA